ncbi:transmembrane protein 176B-like [Cheilinus undulatus]|uniref:transmembrane protein 176B-like n=1 Tax=Cheilinus undulatus TaxID=241271 RepID=UPI001BD41141|nr:transmembrane protein 176B-like [Cheilinus undulatus]
MSVTMTKTDGVTMLTSAADPESSCPPLCQILKGLCCSPACYSVSERLKRVQGASQSVLGAIQIMAGLLTLGLGTILYESGITPWSSLDYTLYHFWLGALFIFFGCMCILSEKRPSPCMVVLNVLLNLVGVGFAITGVVLYILNTFLMWLYWGSCDPNDYRDNYRYNYRERPTSTRSPEDQLMMKKCMEGRELTLLLFKSINGMLIVISLLELCVAMSSVTLGVKALKRSGKTENKSSTSSS